MEVAQGPIREFAQTGEPKYRPQNTINLSMGTPQSGTSNLIGNLNPYNPTIESQFPFHVPCTFRVDHRFFVFGVCGCFFFFVWGGGEGVVNMPT